MPFSLRRLSRISFLAIAIVLVITIAALAISLHRIPSNHQIPINAAKTPVVVQDKAAAPHADFTTLALNLTRFGFEPASINVVAGNYLFAVRNMTGLASVNLAITRKNGDKIIADSTKDGKRRWEQLVKFTPGDYVLTVADNPTWSCDITVLPPGKQ